jgi:hypothetical protein
MTEGRKIWLQALPCDRLLCIRLTFDSFALFVSSHFEGHSLLFLESMRKAANTNSVNMRDLLSQPLGHIPAAVHALLRRTHELDQKELESIALEAGLAVLRAEEAASQGAPDTVAACLRLLNDAMATSDEVLQSVIDALVANGPVLQSSVPVLFRTVILQSRFPPSHDAVAELLLFVANLCDAAETKESTGELCMEGLQKLMTDATKAERSFAERMKAPKRPRDADSEDPSSTYQTTRAAATALINAVKQSKTNKLRIRDWRFVGRALAVTCDFFLQLQCCELLFRVSRVDKGLLESLALSEDLPRAIVDMIKKLPADATLLTAMTGVIENYNASFRPDKNVLGFDVLRVMVGETPICNTLTGVFFAPCFVVIMLNNSADNVTIEYEQLRSIHLLPDFHVQLLLDSIPFKILPLLQGKKDPAVVLQLAGPDQLQRFKDAPLRSWICERRDAFRASKAAGARSAPQTEPLAPGSVQPPITKAKTEDLETPKRPRSASLTLPLPNQRAALGPAAARLPSEFDLPAANTSVRVAAGTSVEPPAAASTVDNSSAKSKKKLRTEGAPMLKSFMSPPDVKPAAAAQPGLNSSAGGELSAARGSLADVISGMMARGDDEELSAVLNQLSAAVEAKKEKRKAEVTSSINEALHDAQLRVDATKVEMQTQRQHFASAQEQRINECKSAHEAVMSQVVDEVGSLNESLSKVGEAHRAVKEQLSMIGLEAYQAIESSRLEEAQVLQGIKEFVEGEVLNLEAALGQHARLGSGSALDSIASALVDNRLSEL